MSSPLPSEDLAIAVAAGQLGWREVRATRFTTGSSFYVYELVHAQGRAVIRMGGQEQRAALVNGVRLNGALRALGVPLPVILHDGTEAPLPYFIMERLPGADLGKVIADLSSHQRSAIAMAVAEAQLAAAKLPGGSGYGFAPDAASAIHRSWGDVVAASIERSRGRILSTGLYPADTADPLLRRLEDVRDTLDRFAPIPFLHDTTTKNVIVGPDGRLSGIVDVDDLCFGDSRYAAALTRAALTAFGGPTDYVNPWLAHMGQAADHVFDFYVAVFLLDFLAEQGLIFNGNPTRSQPEERQRLLDLYQAALRGLG